MAHWASRVTPNSPAPVGVTAVASLKIPTLSGSQPKLAIVKLTVVDTEWVDGRIRRDVRVEGVVQGVGFRPFIYSLATKLGLNGRVGNDVNGVFVEIEGPPAAVTTFL